MALQASIQLKWRFGMNRFRQAVLTAAAVATLASLVGTAAQAKVRTFTGSAIFGAPAYAGDDAHAYDEVFGFDTHRTNAVTFSFTFDDAVQPSAGIAYYPIGDLKVSVNGATFYDDGTTFRGAPVTYANSGVSSTVFGDSGVAQLGFYASQYGDFVPGAPGRERATFAFQLFVNDHIFEGALPSVQTMLDHQKSVQANLAVVSVDLPNDKLTYASASQLLSFSLQETAVPEPSTWALMILGFGAVGTTMRRRRLGAA